MVCFNKIYLYRTDEINTVHKLDVQVINKEETDISFLFNLIDEFLKEQGH